jgi:tetratricopeptide (TPR) repeat protein/predicted Ser/Thr protein kinase
VTDRPEDLLATHFDRLAALPPTQRAAALDALALPAAERDELEALLAADAIEDARLEREIADAAQRLGESVDLAPEAGTRLGPWRIMRELGSGGMGTVLLAERADGAVEQQVAIKLMRGFPTEDGRRRLRQERQVLAQLDHPHIARLLDAGEAVGGQPYFVMEYIEGVPVTTHAARAGLDRRARIDLLDRVAEAVSHAHQRLVIHRDLKPSNVLVRADGTPKLLDFGVAKLLEIGDSGAATSTRVWTPGYASPEQKAGEPVTTATDVFALGVLLRELLTGYRPDGAPCDPPLPAVPVDADLAGVLAKATAEPSADRYPTVEALRDDLARWRDGRPVRAARDTALYRARKFVGRHRGSVSLVLLALVALGAFVWRLGIERDRALAAEALAEQRRVAAEQAATTARGTLGFFTTLLAEAAPDRTLGEPITLRDLLARLQSRIDSDVPGDSAQRAILLGYVGAILANLGEYGPAAQALEPSLAALREQGLDGSATYAGLAGAMAQVEFDAADYAGAVHWAADAARAWRAAASNDADAATAQAEALGWDGFGAYTSGDYAAATGHFREALRAAPPIAGDPLRRDQRADDAHLLVDALRRDGQYEPALVAVDAMIAEVAADGGGRSIGMQRLLRARAAVLGDLGRAADALDALQRSIDLHVAAYGASGSQYASLLNDRGAALKELGRYAEARADLEQALAMRRADPGFQPGGDAASRHNLASVCDSEGDYDCAVREFRALLADVGGTLQPGQRQVVLQGLGRALSMAGQHDEARRLLGQVLQDAEAAASPPAVGATLLHLARNELMAGRFADAVARATQAREIYAAALPPTHFVFAGLDRIEGFAALGRGDLGAAVPAIERYHAATLATDGAGSLWAAIAEVDLARLRHAQGRDDVARDLLRTHLPRLRATLRPTHADRAAAEALAARLAVD